MNSSKLSVKGICLNFPKKIGMTWLLVIIENVMTASLPLFIGFAIDDLLKQQYDKLIVVGTLLVGLTVVAVIRRIYDTRAYGHIRTELGLAVDDRHQDHEVSSRNARLNMSRELVDFLEMHVPEMVTASVQIVVTLVVLLCFSLYLSVSAVAATVGMVLIYGIFHNRFYSLNAGINEQHEKQVTVLERGERKGLIGHLVALKTWEIKLSDTEAVVYGLIFLLQIAFVLFNVWYGSRLEAVTAGMIFSVVTYSWEYVGAATMLPMTMQSWSRLSEIEERINSHAATLSEAV